MDTWDKFRKNIAGSGLVRDGDGIVVAVSGGPDSVCLTHLLWRLRKTVPLGLQLVYMDHGLRRQSRGEARLVEEYGRSLGIPAVAVSLPVRGFSSERKVSLETAGRMLRYRTLVETARLLGYRKIATGHNANDNAETVLMWLIRGTGPDGLSGIPLRRSVDGRDDAGIAGPLPWLAGTPFAGNRRRGKPSELEIVRPLLPVTREEVMAYLESQGLRYRIDRSNRSFAYTRNRLRHAVVPVLQKHNPGLVDHLFSFSRIMAAESGYLGEIAARVRKRAVTADKNRISLDLKVFFRYNKVIRMRVLKDVLPEKKSVAQVERLYDWILSRASKDMTYSSSWKAGLRGDRLVFYRNTGGR